MKKIVLLMILILPFFVYAKEEVTLNKCVDGDTINVSIGDKVKKVRMLAIDTPESVPPSVEEPYGKEAAKYTCELVTNAAKIELEYDPNSDEVDKYGRVLAWVFIDGELLQEKIIRNGYGEVAYLYDDYKYTKILEENEELAKAEKLNMWSNVDPDGNPYINALIGLGFIILGYLLNLLINKLKRIIKKSKIYVKLS